MKYDELAKVLEVNVLGASATLIAALPRMCARGRGQLVGVSSLARYRATPKMAGYSASKAFLSSFLEGLRLDLQGTGVAITDIRPGFVKTDIIEGIKNPPFVMEAERAASIMATGIEQKKRVIEFPLPMATLAKGAALLPNALYEQAWGGGQARGRR
jgi:short-subunit dehydrogenase